MFADRNFATGLVFMAVTGVLLLAGLALLPPLLQNLYGYSVLQSGFLTAPRGIGTLISMLVAGRLVGKVDARAAGRHRRGADGRVAVDDDRLRARSAVAPGDHQRRRPGPRPRPDLRAAAEPGLRDAGAAASGPPPRALLNLSRNIGGSVGISVVSAQLVRMTQVAHADMASHVTARPIPTAEPSLLQTHRPAGRSRWRSSTPRSPGRRCSSPISTISS